MEILKFCSNCGKKNSFGKIEGKKRFFCLKCNTIHYENPKPTVVLICIKKEKILLVKRAINPGKGKWGLPGGFIEKSETPEMAAIRELYEETNLEGRAKKIIGTCSHFGSVFGDILLIGITMQVKGWERLLAGDDAAEAKLFSINKTPKLAFPCYEKILNIYLKKLNY